MGTLHGSRALLLRNNVGSAMLGEVEYELTTSMQAAPIVKNKATGISYAFDWEEIVELARKAGIDDPASTKEIA